MIEEQERCFTFSDEDFERRYSSSKKGAPPHQDRVRQLNNQSRWSRRS